MLLAHKLEQPIPDQDQANAAAAKQRAAARRQILRTVENNIAQSAKNPQAKPAADALRAELVERLAAPDIEEDIGTRTIFEIIGTVMQDLGLTPDMHGNHNRRTPQDVATLCARAAALPPPRPSGSLDTSRSTEHPTCPSPSTSEAASTSS